MMPYQMWWLLLLLVCEARPITDTLTVRSEGHGSWGRRALDPALRWAFPDVNVTWMNGPGDCDLVVRSLYNDAAWPYTAPYITWSSEARPVALKTYPPLCELTNYRLLFRTVPGYDEHPSFYVPYAIDAPFTLPHIRIHVDNPRPYWLAYISSNCQPHREMMFDRFWSRLGGNDFVHGLGRCKHNRNGTLGASWFVNGDIYQDYVFALVMENNLTQGYLTEKLTLAFRGGAIPIYWGSEVAFEVFNRKAMIWVNEFASWDACVERVWAMIQDRRLIAAMQAEPVFANGVVSEYFRVDEWPPPQWIRDIGRHIRRAYRLS